MRVKWAGPASFCGRLVGVLGEFNSSAGARTRRADVSILSKIFDKCSFTTLATDVRAAMAIRPQATRRRAWRWTWRSRSRGRTRALRSPALLDAPRVSGGARRGQIRLIIVPFPRGSYAPLRAQSRTGMAKRSWHHGRHHGRLDWWWGLGGIWYYYPEDYRDEYPDDDAVCLRHRGAAIELRRRAGHVCPGVCRTRPCHLLCARRLRRCLVSHRHRMRRGQRKAGGAGICMVK
jgi:hypothetical protein